MKKKRYYPIDTGRKLNVHKTFRRRPERLLNVLCTFNLRPVSTGYHTLKVGYNNCKILGFACEADFKLPLQQKHLHWIAVKIDKLLIKLRVHRGLI